MTLEHASLLKQYHLKCEYDKFHTPVAWGERLDMINALIERIKKTGSSAYYPK